MTQEQPPEPIEEVHSVASLTNIKKYKKLFRRNITQPLLTTKASRRAYLAQRNMTHAVADLPETTPETIPSLVGEDSLDLLAQKLNEIEENQLTDETDSATIPRFVTPELGDEQLMTPVPEAGTWFKTGTKKALLIEALQKLKQQK